MTSINYQQRICSTTLGLEGTRIYINEYKCLDVAFDGWKETECLFLEAKGKYDQFFKGDGDPWYDGVEDTFNQGTRHQFVIESLENVLIATGIFCNPKVLVILNRNLRNIQISKCFTHLKD
ncbi:TPA: Tox-REase-5 domain-containing protein [Providencia stuartii]|uniref:Tox-REase-5 domain-containing protein n=1 Tax=Providencia TaxID=586 RepID=UPI0009BCD00D|nr:hypothetical protein CEP70_06275 [Providencia stuartii]EMD1717877.1 hypothetical protein [Providencia stuartii]MBG5904077.1 hypothetical protein [Providencia stuartii]MBG5906397.1 hypothetical protein [Providencia stuartii]MBG5910639.1 hypothetical protein [Providencia stuartii]